MTSIVWIHLAVTLWMKGLIWFVQTVHYPLFASVGNESFPSYHRRHVRNIGFLVGPVMITEALCATGLLIILIGTDLAGWAAAGWVLLLAIWLSTWLIQVPAHHALGREPGPQIMERLTTGNRIRTVGWSGRTVLAIALAMQSAAGDPSAAQPL